MSTLMRCAVEWWIWLIIVLVVLAVAFGLFVIARARSRRGGVIVGDRDRATRRGRS